LSIGSPDKDIPFMPASSPWARFEPVERMRPKMRTFAVDLSASELLKRWHSQVGPRLLMPYGAARPGIALGYLVDGPVAENLICIEDLILTVLYDEQRKDGTTRTRLAGYSGRAIAWGASWGGRSQHKFEKSLSLPPERCAQGARIDLTRARLLEHGLELDRLVERSNLAMSVQPIAVRLPTVWAAFRPAEARCLKPAGPEWENLRKRLGASPSELFANYRRRYLGLILLPLEWVSHAWQQWVTLFADLSQFPTHQCLGYGDPVESLKGFSGAMKYDLLASRFKAASSRQPPILNQQHLAAAIA
jgi:hypothetical protein